MNLGLDTVLQLNPVTFNWKYNDQSDYGFLAEDLEKIDPMLVFYKDGQVEGVKYDRLTAILANAIQEQQGQIASISGQLANLSLTDTGEVQIIAQAPPPGEIPAVPVYSLKNNTEIIDRIGAFAEVVVANIRAGAITTRELVSDQLVSLTATIDNLLITNGLVSPVVQTNLISPLADESDVVIRLGRNTSGESKATPDVLNTPEESFGKLAIQNAQGEEVASIDSSGQVTADSVQINTASVSGELYADTIKSKTLDEIQELLRKVETDQDLLAQAKTWQTPTATDSASLTAIATSGQLDSLTARQLFITDQAAVSSLSVTSTVTIGSDLVISSIGNSLENGNWKIENSLNSLSAPLRIQSLAMAPIEIMAGKIRIETNGDVKINANLYVAGKIESESVKTKEITTERLVIAATNTSGESSSAQSPTSGEPGLTPEVSSASGIIKSNAVAGTAVIPAGLAELEIENSKIENSSLIYVTPTSTTENNVLFVKSKETGKFTVGFTDPININVTFNWWVIETKTESGN